MADPKRKAITLLDLVLIFMTAAWILFGVFRGITLLELAYNWIYVVVAILTLILNIKIINEKKN